MTTRSDNLRRILEGYKAGLWTTKNGERRRISNLTDKEIQGIIYHLKNYAIASIHYDIFMLGDNGYRNDMLVRYEEDFPQLLMDKLSTHPVWKFIQREVDKRGLVVVE